MKRHRISRLGIWVLICALLCLGVSLSQAQESKKSQNQSVYISDEVHQALEQGSANVLIVLKVPARRQAAQAMTAVAAAQTSVLNALPANSYTLTALYSHLGVISATIQPAALNALMNRSDVLAVNLDQTRHVFDAQSDALTKIDQVHAEGSTGQGVRVAVIDTGINQTHTALMDDLFYERCFRIEGDCPNGPNDAVDQHGHGTHVSGTITGANGVAPDAEIAAYKVFITGTTPDTNILNALNDIIANDATLQIDVINMSLGAAEYGDQASCDAANAAYATTFAQLNALGIAIFVSTGNDANINGVSSPGCVTGAIGVGSVGDAGFTLYFSNCTDNGAADKVSCYSNTTATQGEGELLDILAPGCMITAEWVGSTTAENTICGTSMASPTAAGIGATLLSVDPSLTPLQLEELIESTGTPVTDYRNSVVYPRINAKAAFDKLAIELPTPNNLVASAASPNQVNLTWDDITGETHYIIQRSADNGQNWTTIETIGQDVTSYQDTEVSCGLSSYRVRGTNTPDQTFSLFSNVASTTARECPLAPTQLVATEQSETVVQLNWTDQAGDETNYLVERSSGSGWAVIATLPANTAAYTDSGLACAILSYRVRAVRNSGDYSPYSNIAAISPCAPSNDLIEHAEMLVENYSDTETRIRYATTSSSDPALTCRGQGAHVGSNNLWYVYRSLVKGFISVDTLGSNLVPPAGNATYNDTVIAIYTGSPGALTEVACAEDIPGISYLSQITDFAVNAGTTYYIVVARWNTAPLSFDATVKVNFTAKTFGNPANLVASSGTNQIGLAWTVIAPPTALNLIERRKIDEPNFVQFAMLSASITNYTDISVGCAQYFYRVRAFDTISSKYSAYSNTVSSLPTNCSRIPDNDLFANAELIPDAAFTDIEWYGQQATRADSDPQFPKLGGCTTSFPRSGSHGVWYRYTPLENTVVAINTNGTIGDSVLGVFTESGGVFTAITCDDDSGDGSNSALNNLALTGGTTYYFHIGSYGSPTSNAIKYVVNFSPDLAPVFTMPTSYTADEGVPLAFNATASPGDFFGQTLTYSLAGAVPAGAAINPSTGAFTWTPAEDQDGTATFDVVVSDGVLSDTETITITVNEVNTAPILNPIGNQTATQAALLTFTASAADSDLPANTWTFSLDGAPANAIIDPASGEFSWTPDASQLGEFTFKVRVTDSGGMSAEETITVSVNAGNTLLLNSSFEDQGSKTKNADQWTGQTLTKKDRRACPVLPSKLIHSGGCAFKFQYTGATPLVRSISQSVTPDGLQAGDVLMLSGWVKAKTLTGKARLQIKVQYASDEPQTLKVKIRRGTYPYEIRAGQLSLTDVPTQVTVSIQLINATGRLYVDDLSLFASTPLLGPGALLPLPVQP